MVVASAIKRIARRITNKGCAAIQQQGAPMTLERQGVQPSLVRGVSSSKVAEGLFKVNNPLQLHKYAFLYGSPENPKTFLLSTDWFSVSAWVNELDHFPIIFYQCLNVCFGFSDQAGSRDPKSWDVGKGGSFANLYRAVFLALLGT